MAQTGTLTKCTDGLEPLFVSTSPNGDRNYPNTGDNTLKVFFVDGNQNNGSRLTVKTYGTYNFGEPDRRFQNLKISGKSIRYNGENDSFLEPLANKELIKGYSSSANGQGVDAASPFNGSTAVQMFPASRHANLSHCFRGVAFSGLAVSVAGNLSWPIAYDPTKTRTTVAGDKFFATWYEYHETNGSKIQHMVYSNLVGSFSTGANAIPTVSGNFLTGDGWVDDGDPVTVVGARTANGWVKYVGGGFIYIELDESHEGSAWQRGDFDGAVVTSAAGSCTLVATTQGVDYFAAGALKTARVYEGVSAEEAGAISNIIGGNGSLTTTSRNQANNNSIADKFDATPRYIPRRQWIRRTVWFDYTGVNAQSGIINGNQIGTTSVDKQNRFLTKGPVLALWGNDPAGGSENGFAMRYGELISYTSNIVCVLSESPTWAGADWNQSEVLLLERHVSNNEAVFLIDSGRWSSISGKYLYVLTAPNSPTNTNGVLL